MLRALLVLASCFAFACSSGEPGSDAPPYVVLISIDTLRADALGTYGQTRATSPFFDSLAAQSIVFTHAYAQAGQTAASHMTLFTSLYPSVHRVSNYHVDEKLANSNGIVHFRVDPKVTTLAQSMKRAGYATAAFTGGGNLNHETGFDQGFDVFDADPSNGMNGFQQPFDVSRASQWIDANKSGRFFLFLHTYMPHGPYLPPAPWNTAFDPDYVGKMYTDRASYFAQKSLGAAALEKSYWDRFDAKDPRDLRHLLALYHGGVRAADDALAKMIDALKQSGVWDKALVLVVSDHGEEFLEHGQVQHPGELYRELVHVPFLLHLPTGEAKRIDAPVRLIDVLPTLCEFVGAPVPKEAQGASLVPLIRGTRSDRPVISETVFSWLAAKDQPLRPNEFLRTLRAGEWMYLVITGADRRVEELYKVSDDPNETKNLIADPNAREVLERLRRAMADHDRECERLAGSFQVTNAGDLSEKTRRQLESLGYAK